jgi:hypothetical protein
MRRPQPSAPMNFECWDGAVAPLRYGNMVL